MPWEEAVAGGVTRAVAGVTWTRKRTLLPQQPFLQQERWVYICNNLSRLFHPENHEKLHSFLFFYSHCQPKVMIAESDIRFFHMCTFMSQRTQSKKGHLGVELAFYPEIP